MFDKIIYKILLFIHERRLKRYRHDSLWYKEHDDRPNWFVEFGIPREEVEIEKIKQLIKEI